MNINLLKRAGILSFGAKEAIVEDAIDKRQPYFGKLDYMISTIAYAYDVSGYASVVKLYGNFMQVGVPVEEN